MAEVGWEGMSHSGGDCRITGWGSLSQTRPFTPTPLHRPEPGLRAASAIAWWRPSPRARLSPSDDASQFTPWPGLLPLSKPSSGSLLPTWSRHNRIVQLPYPLQDPTNLPWCLTAHPPTLNWERHLPSLHGVCRPWLKALSTLPLSWGS